MDSLTQIVLGAAVGEITLGKKIGNRALLWGGVGGTIPDLDIVFGVFMTPIEELAAHRGFSHSIVFAVLGGIVFGYLLDVLYRSKYHKYLASVGWLLIPAGVTYFIKRIFDGSTFGLLSSIPLILLVAGMIYLVYLRYYRREIILPTAELRDWQWLMFWSLLTHPILDCFTTYGTQLFSPFSDYRVAFNTIAVADPFYTLPFLICVIVLSFFNRHNSKRRRLAWLGLTISSIYMIFCVVNKQRVNDIWQETLASAEIDYSRYMTSPSILSNFLWTCIAETDEGYVTGQYSIFDKEPRVIFESIQRIETLDNISLEDHPFERLRWFSNDYYSIIDHPQGLQFNDLRFGSSQTKSGDRHYIFNFILKKEEDLSYRMIGNNGGPPPGEEREMISMLWERIKGI